MWPVKHCVKDEIHKFRSDLYIFEMAAVRLPQRLNGAL